MNLNIGEDWQYLGDLETVTYQVRSAAGLADGISVSNVLAREIDVTALGFMGKAAVVFHLWTTNLSGIVPKIDDQITRLDGTSWTVKRVEVADMANRYRCETIKTRP